MVISRDLVLLQHVPEPVQRALAAALAGVGQDDRERRNAAPGPSCSSHSSAARAGAALRPDINPLKVSTTSRGNGCPGIPDRAACTPGWRARSLAKLGS